MRRFISALVLSLALLVGSASLAPAGERTSAPAPAAYVETIAGSNILTSPILAQYNGDNSYSSSGSTRIPRGAVKLGIFLVIGLISLCGWVLKRVFA